MTLQSLAFLFGALLLLVGILGGGFEVKEIKIPQVPGAGRALASILGFMFIGLAIWQPQLPRSQPQAPAENRLASDNNQHSPDRAPSSTHKYGPDTCIEGFVWREASTTDHVCVTPETRAEAAADNRQTDARRNPSGGSYGRDTCLEGYVWREAFPNDHVCVTPQTREQAAADNGQAQNRVAR